MFNQSICLKFVQSKASRMQLVALHMATTSLLPDELLGMTGEERAITMIREVRFSILLKASYMIVCCVLTSSLSFSVGVIDCLMRKSTWR